VADEFVSLLSKNIQMIHQGNPLNDNVQMGPLARIDLVETLAKQMESTINQGAKLVTGGKHQGCNFEPTLLDFVTVDSVAFQEETFGPLATVIRAKNEVDAINIANNHKYGLAAALWTEDRDRAYVLARRIEAGNVFINSLVRSDSRIPFGGIKKSGYGRELGEIGIKEFMNMKSIIIE
jgi:succinate-semialdehyde dehydrogenase/glutarate-semialdehyde dehydrogenase